MTYKYEKIEGQDKHYLVTADNNGKEIIFSVGVSADESEIDGLVKFHLSFINGNQEPVITYIQKRIAEYPPVSDQLDTLYHGGYEAWKTEIQAIKDKYPKE